MFFNPYYFVFMAPALLLSLYAQFKVQSAFSKYSKLTTRQNLKGFQTAELLLNRNGITNVRVEKVSGSLTDHYNPVTKLLKLSEPVYGSSSISAVGVAAHETGHAIQDKLRYAPLVLRSLLVTPANIGSAAGPYMIMFGLLFNFAGLISLGILVFSLAVAFYLITLPVEIDASIRAAANLRQTGLFTEEELKGVKKVLTAAALTYVASALTAVFNLLYYISLARRRD